MAVIYAPSITPLERTNVPYSGRILRPRILALITYLCYMTAGIAFILLPSLLVSARLNLLGVFVWHAFLIGGGAISALGAYRKRPSMEELGMPLLATALAAYACILFESAFRTGQNGAAFGVGLLMCAGIAELAGRFLEIQKLASIRSDLMRREVER